MKKATAVTTSILGIALAVGFLFSAPSLTAEGDEHEHEQAETSEHQHAEHAESNDTVRCAYDGIMMKASAMTKMAHNGQTHYFCSDKEAERFKAHPDKYLKQISLGHLTLNLNVLTTDEYKEMMQDMGMGGMMKMDAMEGKTHRISVYLTQHNRDIQLENVSFALALTDAKGKETTAPLAYNKMMKAYDAFVALPSSGTHQVRVLVKTSEVNVAM